MATEHQLRQGKQGQKRRPFLVELLHEKAQYRNQDVAYHRLYNAHAAGK